MKSPQTNQIELTEPYHPNHIKPLSEGVWKNRGDTEEAPTKASTTLSWAATMDLHIPIQSSEPPNAPSRSDVDELIRRKRKAREYKACYPCRQRKVKCDQSSVPCKTCVQRQHPELCTYHPPDESHPAKRFNWGDNPVPQVSSGLGGSTVTLTKDEWDRICIKLEATEKSLAELRSHVKGVGEGTPEEGVSPVTRLTPPRPIDSEIRHVTTEGLHTRNFAGETVHLGGSSVPAMVMSISKGNKDDPNLQELFSKSILPLFGLDNISATYPFVDLWRDVPHGSLSGVNQLCGALPSDSDCLRFLRSYKDTAHVLYPGVADIEQFEADLMHFLINRASFQPTEDGIDGVSDRKIYGKSLYWIGLLFAVLASGTQCSAMPRKNRELTAQVFICCSFECLRFTNFFSHPSLETIQTLLVLGNAISNHMNAGVAWSLLGLTIRLAQTIGLHRSCPPSTPHPTKVTRSKIWWAAIWQDSLLSITYDRAVLAGILDRPPYFFSRSPSSTGMCYEECMYKLCLVGVEIVRDRTTPQKSHSAMVKITEHRRDLLDMMNDAADYLRDSRRCKSMRDTLEHWALYLHVSYVTAELCRPAISPTTAEHELTKSLRKTCIDNLANTVEAFLGLHNITYLATRSWAAMHRALSSALLLGILGEPSRNERVQALLDSLITVLTEVTSELDPEEVSEPIKRSLAALRKLSAFATKVPSLSHTVTSGSPSSVPTSDHSNAIEVDESSMNGFSPIINLDMDDSPYALMDSILWGDQKSPPWAMS